MEILLLEKGVPGIIAFVALFMLKHGWKELSTYMSLRVEGNQALQSSMKQMVSGIGEVRTLLEAAEEEHRRMCKRMDVLAESQAGQLTEAQVVNTVTVYAGKCLAELELWWKDRLDKNHFHDSPDMVKARYEERLHSVVGKWRGQLSQYSFKGRSLYEWDSGGIFQVFAHLLCTLYGVQKAVAEGADPLFLPDQAIHYLERRQSMLMGSAREWCRSGKTLAEMIEKEGLGDPAPAVDWLREVRK